MLDAADDDDDDWVLGVFVVRRAPEDVVGGVRVPLLALFNEEEL